MRWRNPLANQPVARVDFFSIIFVYLDKYMLMRYLCLLVLPILLAGCAPSILEYQTAHALGKGNHEVGPYGYFNQHEIVAGVKHTLGVSEKLDLSYGVGLGLMVFDGKETAVGGGLGMKYNLINNKLAFATSLNINYSQGYVEAAFIQPSVLYSINHDSGMITTVGLKCPISLLYGGISGPAITVGLRGMALIKPEIGIWAADFDLDNPVFYFGVGFVIHK